MFAVAAIAKRQMKQGKAMSRRVDKLLAAALALTAVCLGSAGAFSVNVLVGQWFTELEEKSVFLGEPYTIRKQIEDNRPDGTKTATFRFYDNCRYIGELVNVLEWGVDETASGSVYWTKCKTITEGGQTYPCSSLSYYDITDVTDTKLKYRSRGTGTAYTMQKVDASFKIPPSACVSSAPRALPTALR